MVPKTITPVAGETDTTQSQIVFHDEDQGFVTRLAGETDPTAYHGHTASADLASFLSRPLLIDTRLWAEGGFLAHTLNPWTAFLTNPLIVNKLKNFGGFRATMNIRVTLSSSPFYASLGMVTYDPLPDSTMAVAVVVASDEQLVSYSQRPKILLSPQDNMGGELTLPFVYPYNFCPLDVALVAGTPGLADLGLLRYDSPTVLRNYNSVALGAVNVTTYAWLTDVVLTQNTQGIVVQSSSKKVGFKKRSAAKSRRAKLMAMTGTQDEYSDSPVSGLASAVASAAGQLTNVPIIGPYMRATEMGAGYLSNIASWFGFTNVPVIDDHKPYTPRPFPNFASSEISAAVDRLTLDPKNELTIDSRVCGLDGSDELAIEGIVTRESYLTTFTWGEDDVAGDGLWYSLVTPQLYRMNVAESQIWPTPAAHVSFLFNYWTGDVEFRFVVMATKFHMGRIRIEYEPSTYTETTDSMLVNSSQVFDIGDTKDFTVRVPYSQLRQWRSCISIDATMPLLYSSAGIPSTTGLISGLNGLLKVYVQNALSGPGPTQDVTVAVFVRGCENLAFSAPRDVPPSCYLSAIQSSSVMCRDECVMAPESLTTEWLGSTDDVVSESYGVYMGETVKSVRQLMHRDSFYLTLTPTGGATSNKRIGVVIYHSMFGRLPGYWAGSLHRRLDNVGINYVAYTPMTWMMPCFVGVRGSVNWTANSVGELASEMSFAKGTQPRNSSNLYTLTVLATTDGSSVSRNAYYRVNNFANEFGVGGMTITNQRTNSGVSANVPYYSSARFSYTNPTTLNATAPVGSADHLGARQNVIFRTEYTPAASGTSAANNAVDLYLSAGHDFNLILYKNAPVIFLGPRVIAAPAL
jgi:hypothetical protein